jgi:hypothetical protein
MIVSASPESALVACVVASVAVARSRYEVLPPEDTRFCVRHGQLIAVPLYDGDLVGTAGWMGVLRYVRTVSLPELESTRSAAGPVASHRAALFRVIGSPNDGATLQVLLRLPKLQEKCTSCRTVHFFLHVQ